MPGEVENRSKKQIENEDQERQWSDDDMVVILDMYLEDLSSVRVAKEIMSINPQQRMILASTSPLNDIKNLVKDVAPIKENEVLIKPFRFSQFLSLSQTMIVN